MPGSPAAATSVGTQSSAEKMSLISVCCLTRTGQRIIALEAGLTFSVLLLPVLWLMLALTSFTAVQRFVKVWIQASQPRERDEREPRPDLSERWRAWRESREGREHSATWSVSDWRFRDRSGTPHGGRRSGRAWRRRAGVRRP